MAINSNSENVDAIYRNLYEFLFMDLYLADNVSLLSYAACDAGTFWRKKLLSTPIITAICRTCWTQSAKLRTSFPRIDFVCR